MKIQLTNFQSHKDSTVETFGGITALTGSTSAGKSSFIRAIQHLKDNSLRGDSYVRKGQDVCTISLDTTFKVKSKKDNYYLIDGDKKEALRACVPIEVTQALNLSSECIQTQHNSIFLLNKTPGQVAAKLSELIDLDTAHRSIKLVDQEKKAQYGELNALNISIGKRNDKIKDLNNIDVINKELGKIERKAIRIQEEFSKLESLRKVTDNCITRLKEKDSLPDVSRLNDCTSIINEAHSIIKAQIHLSSIQSIINNYHSALNDKNNLPDIYKLSDCLDIIKQAREIVKEKSKLSILQQSIVTAKDTEKKLIEVPPHLSMEISTLQNEYKKLDKLHTIVDNAKNQIDIKKEFSGIGFTKLAFNESIQNIKNSIMKSNVISKTVIEAKTFKKTIENNKKRLDSLNILYKERLGKKCPFCQGKIK